MATTTRDFAVRFTVSDNIDEATKRIEKGRERIAAQMRAMGDEYGKLDSLQKRELKDWALIEKGWNTAAKASLEYFYAVEKIQALQNKGRLTEDVAKGYLERAKIEAAQRLQFEEQARDRRKRSAGGGVSQEEIDAQKAADAASVRNRALQEARAAQDAKTRALEASQKSRDATAAAATNPALMEEEVNARRKAEDATRAWQSAVQRLKDTQAEATRLGITGLDQEIKKIKDAAAEDRIRVEQSRVAAAQAAEAAKQKELQDKADAEIAKQREAQAKLDTAEQAKRDAAEKARQEAVAEEARTGVGRNRALDEARKSEELRTRMIDATRAFSGAKTVSAADPTQVEAEIKARKQLESAVRAYRESLERLKAIQTEASNLHVAGLDKEIAAIRAAAAVDRRRIEQSRVAVPPPPAQRGYGLGSFAFPETKGLVETLNKLSFSLFVITFGTQQLGEIFLRTFVQAGEKIEALRFRMEGLTGSTETFGKVAGVAMELGIGLEDLAGSFVRFAIANATLGLTNDELVLMTRNIAALGLIGGGTTEEIKAGMTQLGQAMASGKLQGDELRSLMENMPYLVLKLAKSMDQPIGAMKELGKAGKIATSDITKAMLGIKKEVDQMMENIPITSERGIARIQTAWGEMIDSMLRTIGVDTVGTWFSNIAADLKSFGDSIDNNKLRISSWLDAAGAIAPTILGAVVGWKTLVPLAALATNAFRTSMLAVVGYTDSILTMTTRQTKGMSDATKFFAVMANTGPLTAATRAIGMITSAFFPLIAVLGIAAAAFIAYRDSRDEAMTKAQGTIDSVMNDVDALKSMSRSALLTQQNNLEIELKGINDRLAAARESVESLKKDQAASVGMDARFGRLTIASARYSEQIATQNEAVRQLTEEQERGTLALQANKDAQAGVAGVAAAAIKGVRDWSEVITKATKDQDKLTESLQKARLELELIKNYGPNEAKDMLPLYEQRAATEQALAELDRQRAEGEARRWTKDEADRNESQRQVQLDNLRTAEELYKVQRQQREETDRWEAAHKKSPSERKSIGKPEDYAAVQRMKEDLDILSRAVLLPASTDVSQAIKEFSDKYKVTSENIKAVQTLFENQRKSIAAADRGGTHTRTLDTVIQDETRSALFAWADDFVRATKQAADESTRASEQAAKKAEEIDKASTKQIADNAVERLRISTNYYDREAELRAKRDAAIIEANNNDKLNETARDDAILLAKQQYTREVIDLAQQRTDYQVETDRMILENARTNGTELSAMEKERNLAALDYTNAIRAISAAERNREVEATDAASRRAAEYAAFKNKLEDIKATRFEGWAKDVGQAFAEAFGTMAKGGETVHDTLMRLKDALRDMVIQLLIIKPLSEAISGFLGGMVYGSTKPSEKTSAVQAASSVAGNAVVQWVGGLFTHATGNLITASLSPGLYSAPTYFPMGTPGRHAFASGTGLLGEAGPEFVMPATRMPDGRLGVAAMASGASSEKPSWNVTVNNQVAAHGVQVNPRQDAQGGLTLDVVMAHLSSEVSRGGSSIARSMESTYPGLRRARM